jgi:hypothetical protein
MGGTPLSEVDERIIERFLAVQAARRDFNPEAARAFLLEMYPALAPRLEIVMEGARRILIRRE